MELTEAIYNRRSIRMYKSDPVGKSMVEKLLQTATMAPSASNQQPWAFAVIQDISLLKKYSDRAKAYFLKLMEGSNDASGYQAILAKPDFNIFYDAGTLVIIYAKNDSKFAVSDCCLAAQNLMLAAHGEGLGTCWIGFSVPFLESVEAKQEMDVPENYKVAAAIIIGYPAVQPSGYTRKAPEILAWK